LDTDEPLTITKSNHLEEMFDNLKWTQKAVGVSELFECEKATITSETD